MARKVSKTSTTGENAVEPPVALVLETVEISKCNIERPLPRFKAPKGTLEHELSLDVHLTERDGGEQGVLGTLSVLVKGKNAAEGSDTTPFSIAFEMEGFYRPAKAGLKLREGDLTQRLAQRIAHELYPLAMMRCSELLGMIGYGGVRLTYGTALGIETYTP